MDALSHLPAKLHCIVDRSVIPNPPLAMPVTVKSSPVCNVSLLGSKTGCSTPGEYQTLGRSPNKKYILLITQLRCTPCLPGCLLWGKQSTKWQVLSCPRRVMDAEPSAMNIIDFLPRPRSSPGTPSLLCLYSYLASGCVHTRERVCTARFQLTFLFGTIPTVHGVYFHLWNINTSCYFICQSLQFAGRLQRKKSKNYLLSF